MSETKNEVVYNKDFLRDVRRIPEECRHKLGELIGLLKNDPFDPRLHTKPLSAPLQGIFSFRITRDYRVGFKFLGPRLIHLISADH